jgi:hypothetical protein
MQGEAQQTPIGNLKWQFTLCKFQTNASMPTFPEPGARVSPDDFHSVGEMFGDRALSRLLEPE